MAKDQLYRHVKVPGFGCTYPNDYSSSSTNAEFTLIRLIKDESIVLKSKDITLIYVIEAGTATLGSGTKPLDFEAIQFVPAGMNLKLQALTPTVKAVLISFSKCAVDACIDEYQLDSQIFEKSISKLTRLPRTLWQNELCHRYAFERSIAKSSSSLAARFLELEILKELYYANRSEKNDPHDAPFFAELPDSLKQALLFIERNLHSEIVLDDLVRVANSSKPTLVRLFRRYLQTSPMKYFWTRRLEEADRLLLSGRFNVSQISEIIGFSDPSTFSESYKAHFGFPPSRRTT
jgi:AraC-like DNA-binding protein